MQFLQIFIIVVFLIACLILMFFILIQSGKGGSMGILGGASNTTFGASTMDIIEKLTWWGILIFFILALISAILFAVPRKKIELPIENNIPTETQNPK